MFVYKDDTSRVTSKALGGMSSKSCSLLRRWVAMFVLKDLDENSVTNSEIFSVGCPFADTMGRPGFPGLWIFADRVQKRPGLGFSGVR